MAVRNRFLLAKRGKRGRDGNRDIAIKKAWPTAVASVHSECVTCTCSFSVKLEYAYLSHHEILHEILTLKARYLKKKKKKSTATALVQPKEANTSHGAHLNSDLIHPGINCLLWTKRWQLWLHYGPFLRHFRLTLAVLNAHLQSQL